MRVGLYVIKRLHIVYLLCSPKIGDALRLVGAELASALGAGCLSALGVKRHPIRQWYLLPPPWGATPPNSSMVSLASALGVNATQFVNGIIYSMSPRG